MGTHPKNHDGNNEKTQLYKMVIMMKKIVIVCNCCC